MSQLEAYLEMDSTDERIFRQQQKIREDEAREQAKRVQKELAAKRRANANMPQSDPMQSISSADFAPNNAPGPGQTMNMQANPTANGQGMGGTSSLTSGASASTAPSESAAAATSSNPLADAGGMFGASAAATETLGARRADGAGQPRRAMQLGKAKKLPNNLNLI